MTTPNPWERLREAAEYFVDAALVYASEMTFRDFLAKWPKADSIDIIREAGLAKLRQALAALPANPPEQPSSDAERAAPRRATTAPAASPPVTPPADAPSRPSVEALQYWTLLLRSRDLSESQCNAVLRLLLDDALAGRGEGAK